jgi:hypothetical protein
VDATDEGGAPLDLADVTAVLTATSALSGTAFSGEAAGAPSKVVLRQVAPGRYETIVPSSIGITLMEVEIAKEGVSRRLQSGWWWDGPDERFSLGRGHGQLEAIVGAGGGAIVAGVPETAEHAAFGTPPWLVFVICAALLWLLDVAGQLGVRLRWRRSPGKALDAASEWSTP